MGGPKLRGGCFHELKQPMETARARGAHACILIQGWQDFQLPLIITFTKQRIFGR